MKKFLAAIVLIGLVCLCLGVRPSCASEVDVLLQKLVEKGILDASEAQEIRSETDEAAAKTEKERQEDYKKLAKDAMPGWVKDAKLKGGFRLRHQYEKRKGGNNAAGVNSIERNRARIRYRLGLETKVNDQVKVAAGLASGSSDPRSTNQTLDNTFETKAIMLDYAYAAYSPFAWAQFTGGKMQNPIWQPADLLWDSDITPEGMAASLKHDFSPVLNLYLNSAWFILEEFADSSDPWMYIFQPGAKWKVNGKMDLNTALGFYGFQQVKGATLAHNSNSNTRNVGTGSKKYDFDSINPCAQISVKEPLGFLGIGIPYGSLFGEYINNYSANDSNTGYAAGLKIGHEKAEKWGQWQAKYQYAMLGTDAWLDNLPDSDRYGGRTGVRSHEVVFTCGLGKNWALELDYYHSDLTNTKDATEDLFQTDLNFKF